MSIMNNGDNGNNNNNNNNNNSESSGILDFIAKIAITIIFIYVVAYFTGYSGLLKEAVNEAAAPVIKNAQQMGKEALQELDKHGISVPDEVRKQVSMGDYINHKARILKQIEEAKKNVALQKEAESKQTPPSEEIKQSSGNEPSSDDDTEETKNETEQSSEEDINLDLNSTDINSDLDIE
ncbi:MAG: hypothetical protein IJ730_00330 [Alphaproteobacteria bacterium]|nr:hypothetical protein [Alphaproteobacteria bacterium]